MKRFSILLAVVLLATCIWAADKGTDMSHNAMMAGVHRIVFTGNSLTDGSAWPDWVIETLQANGYPKLILHNAGVAGNSTAQVKARYQKDILALKPDLVIVNVGTVDAKPPEDYRRDMGDMVREIRKSGAKMVLMTPAPLRDPDNPKYHECARAYAPVIRELATTYDCAVADTQAYFAEGVKAGKEMWGPDGVHHKIDGWRAMARCVLDALGCQAPMIEKTSMYYNVITDWYIAPPVPWKPGIPVVLRNMPEDYDPIAAGRGAYPSLPDIPDGFAPLAAGWRKFDRNDEIAKTSWWQKCWLERGGVMPMGQAVNPERPGAQSRDFGAYALAIVHAEHDTNTTLHVGGSLPYAVWLNGRMVWNGNFLHGYHPDADRFPITLKKGENHILVFTNWLFYVSLGDF